MLVSRIITLSGRCVDCDIDITAEAEVTGEAGTTDSAKVNEACIKCGSRIVLINIGFRLPDK